MQTSHALSGFEWNRKSSVEAPSDEALMTAIAQDDQSAMRVLFARHNVRVFRFLRRFIGNEATAEELVSEVFIEVWRHAGRFQARSQVSTWILGIARFKALSARRRRCHEALDESVDETMADPSDDPEVVEQKFERSAILRDCIKQLSPAHREIIDLVYYHQQSIGEVADIINIPPNTVKTRMHYARKRLSELFAARGVDRASLL